jgi:hypothetical protein
MELFFVTIVLTGNEVTKLFFLSPHVQVFNLLIPCLALYASARLIGRGRALSTAEALLLGVAFGVGLLIYASFAIALLCVAAIQLLAYRRPVSAGSMVLVAGAIFGLWALFVYLRTGFYYNYEVAEFRQFVWIVDCVRQGPAQCALDVSRRASDFMGATARCWRCPWHSSSRLACPPCTVNRPAVVRSRISGRVPRGDRGELRGDNDLPGADGVLPDAVVVAARAGAAAVGGRCSFRDCGGRWARRESRGSTRPS